MCLFLVSFIRYSIHTMKIFSLSAINKTITERLETTAKCFCPLFYKSVIQNWRQIQNDYFDM